MKKSAEIEKEEREKEGHENTLNCTQRRKISKSVSRRSERIRQEPMVLVLVVVIVWIRIFSLT